MKRSESGHRRSLKARLILAFLLTSIFPVIVMNLFSYYHTSGIVLDHVRELTHSNLVQTRSSLDVWMESYEDILFQIYTDDDIVDMIDHINSGEDVSVNKNQLRRTLHGLFYTKDYIKCITVLTENGTMVCYDMVTGSNVNSWIDTMEIGSHQLYDQVSEDNATHIFSTQTGIKKGGKEYFLFHIGHRIIDYRDVEKRLGIVMVSIDEEMLKNVCIGQEKPEHSYNFIVDARGRMVSHPDQTLLASQVIEWSENPKERQQRYKAYAQNRVAGEKSVMVDCVYDEIFGWDIVNVSSQDKMLEGLENQQKMSMSILLVSLLALVGMIALVIRGLTGSLKKLVAVMEKAGKGDLSVRVEPEKSMPSELEVISTEFNRMMTRLSESLQKEKEAGEKQRNAEIAALEAQLNPHFLYNTLDTINWMAIDHGEYEISNSINALANILRYGIDNSNGIVTVRQEQEWLKKYLFLQQTRLKNTFSCEIHTDPDALEVRIHKLLFQPFVENAIIHGFEGVSRKYFLSVLIERQGEELYIEIYDNGRGISPEIVEQMNQGIFPRTERKSHIGMENAVNRIHIYYGEQGKVALESEPGEYTRVKIRVPALGRMCEEEKERQGKRE